MSVVVDASMAVKWVLDQPGSEAAAALLDEKLVAPALWLVEVANLLWKRVTRGEIDAAEAAVRLDELRRHNAVSNGAATCGPKRVARP